jgi:hypothetical protein
MNEAILLPPFQKKKETQSRNQSDRTISTTDRPVRSRLSIFSARVRKYFKYGVHACAGRLVMLFACKCLANWIKSKEYGVAMRDWYAILGRRLVLDDAIGWISYFGIHYWLCNENSWFHWAWTGGLYFLRFMKKMKDNVQNIMFYL